MGLRFRRIVLLLVGALLLAACGPLGRQPTADEIVQEMRTAFENLTSAHAVVEAAATREGETFTVVGETWFQRDGDREQARAEVREAGKPDIVGTLFVSDGETAWLYNPEAGKALTGRKDELEAWKAERGEEWAELPADYEALTAFIDRLLEVTDVTLVGEETIAGRDAWHVQLTPNDQAPRAWQAAGGSVDLWVDRERNLPLQVSYTGGPEAAGEIRMTVQQLEVDQPIAPERFQWSPPDGVEVVEIRTLLPQRMTLPEARAEAPFHLLSTPGDSPEATLVEVFRQGEHYVQRFEGTGGEWTLVQGPAGDHDSEAESGTAVSVRGAEGRLWSDEERGRTVLRWTEEGVTRVIAGRLSPDNAVAIAETLE